MTLTFHTQPRKLQYWVIRPGKYLLIYASFAWWWFLPIEAGLLFNWQLSQFLSVLTSIYLPIGAALVVINYSAVFWLKRARPLYRWRFGNKTVTDAPPENVIARLVQMRYIGLPNLLLIVFNVPTLALMEELLFRYLPGEYVAVWLKPAILIGVSMFVFGAVHLSSGYDLGTVAVLTILGAGPLTVAYAWGGLLAAVELHVAINLIALPVYGATHNSREPFERALRKLKLIPG